MRAVRIVVVCRPSRRREVPKVAKKWNDFLALATVNCF